MKIFVILYIEFAILSFIEAFMVITKRLNSVGYAVIPMLFSMTYGSSKKLIEDSKK